ncbi:MAG TPA: vanadium-dependent haloperoxidase [Gemmatimonadales bacterium]|nr:vanadium-dependent haloperoxidase [Gemmatimonadales bacterium]
MSAPRSRRSLAFLIPVLATLALAGCDNDTAAPDPNPGPDGGVGGRRPLATLAWNAVARSSIEKFKPGQQAALRGMAYLTLAQFGAADAADGQWPRPSTTSGAVAGASAVVLTYLYPADSAAFDAEVRTQQAALDPGQQKGFLAGETLGRAVGARAVALARGDRFDAPWTGTVPTGPGIWFSSANPAAPPVLPLLGLVQPFFMTAGSQFRPAPPPAFGSPAFQEALAEVRGIADTRTAQQDSIAKFWAMGTGTLIAGFWNSTAAELIERHRLGEREAAHTLALMNTAAMDGLIACADAKYTYWLLRPSQADPAISLAIGLPNFPSYPSNHACFSGAAAYVLGALFPGDEQRLAGMAYDAGVSRVLGGIHYRFDSDVGLQIARDVTRLALDMDRGERLLGLLR